MGIHRLNAVIYGLAGKAEALGSIGTGKKKHSFGVQEMALLMVLAHHQPDPCDKSLDPKAFGTSAKLSAYTNIPRVDRVRNFLVEKELITAEPEEPPDGDDSKKKPMTIYRVRLDTLRRLSAGDDEQRWIEDILHLSTKQLKKLSDGERRAYQLTGNGWTQHPNGGTQHPQEWMQHPTNNKNNNYKINQQQQDAPTGSVAVAGDSVSDDEWQRLVSLVADVTGSQTGALKLNYLRQKIDKPHYPYVLKAIEGCRGAIRNGTLKNPVGYIVNEIKSVAVKTLTALQDDIETARLASTATTHEATQNLSEGEYHAIIHRCYGVCGRYRRDDTCDFGLSYVKRDLDPLKCRGYIELQEQKGPYYDPTRVYKPSPSPS